MWETGGYERTLAASTLSVPFLVILDLITESSVYTIEMMKSLIMRQVGLRSAARFAPPQKMSLALARSFATYYMDSHEYIIVRATNKIVVLSGELYI